MTPQADPDYKRFSAMGKKQFVAAQGGVCFYCSKPFTKKSKPTRDHLFPRCLGHGLFFNKVMACPKCNQKKGGRMPTPDEIERARVVYTVLGLPSWKVG